MLTNADKQIVARDTALPGLAVLLDKVLLLEKLKALPSLNNAVNVDIQYLRYKPSNSCACTIQVRLEGGARQYFYAKALTAERFQQSWHHPKRQKLIQHKDPHAPLALFDAYIMLLHPAHDRGIAHLGWLIDDNVLKNLLTRCHFPYVKHLPLHVDILRYKPERRLVAKISQDNQVVAVIRTVKASDFSHVLTGTAFGVAQRHVKLYGADGQMSTLITHWQKGESLCPEQGAIIEDNILSTLARDLVALHHAHYLPPIQHDISDEIAALHGVQATFQQILPEHTTAFITLMHVIEQGLQAQSPHLCLIHGDFSLDQVVKYQDKQGNSTLSLLDWDSCVAGHPLMDLATMQARLELQVIEDILPAKRAEHIMQLFLHHYQELSQIELQGFTYFVASALLRLATEPFRKRGEQWAQHTFQLLQRVQTLLHFTSTPALEPKNQAQDLSWDPMLYELTNPIHMQPLLMSALPTHLQGRLTSVNLKRYKVKRRALIEYVIQQEQGQQYILGKYRSKGVDNRSFLIQKALWEHGFDDTARISVPEPLVVLPTQKIWLQRKVEGQALAERLCPDDERLVFLGQAVAEAIKALHQSAVENFIVLPVWTVEHELEILRDRLGKAQRLLPHLAERIQRVLSDSEKLATHLPELPLVSIHRDFYQDQILERDGQAGHMVLLDLDLLCQGHAALDAGNYLAHIQELALRCYHDIHALAPHQNAFVTHFLANNEQASTWDVEIYTLLSLVRHIYLSTQFEERQHTTEPLLTFCEQQLNFYLSKH
ncbi:phosphotransferase family protein [Bisgaard Taxon 45]